MTRINWDEYFLRIAQLVSKRATCPRKDVGAIVIDINNKIVGSGYNGAPKGIEHCTEAGCMLQVLADGKQHCIRVLHAEQNALLQAGEKAINGILYVTVLPCPQCFKLVIQAGIKKVIYLEDYNKIDLIWKNTKKQF